MSNAIRNELMCKIFETKALIGGSNNEQRLEDCILDANEMERNAFELANDGVCDDN